MKKSLPTEEKPVTAQPLGEVFFVNSAGKEHLRKKQNEMVSDNELTQAAGCFRRVPTCKE